MIISLAAIKGGVGKTTTGIHLAAFLNEINPTLLVDADGNRTALKWAAQDKLPFKTVSLNAFPNHAKNYQNFVIDTKGHPDPETLQELCDECDLLILPTSPNFADVTAVIDTFKKVQSAQAKSKVLFTKVKPGRAGVVNSDLANAQEALEDEDIPYFKSSIPELVCLARCIGAGVIVRDYKDSKSPDAWLAHCNLGEEIING